MKKFFHYFSLTQSEQRGFFVLVVLIVFVILFPIMYSFIGENDIPESSISYFDNENKENEEMNYASVDEFHATPLPTRKSEKRIVYFDFDPNELPVADWKKLGFSEKQISVIKNYESKGGEFYVKEDVAKIYSISDQDYKRIAPYIKILKKEGGRFEDTVAVSPRSYSPSSVPSLKIEINQADTSELKRLKGIGSVLSARIIKYRNALGGFCCLEQIGEVYGIAPELYELIMDKIFLDSPVFQKLNINQITKNDLAKHPYISNKEADLIVNYRLQHGNYKGIDNLKEIPVLNENFFRKIEPYLQF